MGRQFFAGAALVALTATTGCFDIEHVIELAEDLSGTATVGMTVDLEPMAKIKASLQGGGGEPSAEAVEKAKKEMLAEREAEREQQMAKNEEMIEELRASLPEGVTLEDHAFEEDGLQVSVHMTFAFDDVRKLPEIELPREEGQGAGPVANPIQKPFEGLTIDVTDAQVTITSEPPNPAEDEEEEAEDGAQGGPGAMLEKIEPMIEEAFETMQVSARIASPLEVVETNAHEQSGDAVSWSYGGEQLMDEESEVEPMRVVFAR